MKQTWLIAWLVVALVGCSDTRESSPARSYLEQFIHRASAGSFDPKEYAMNEASTEMIERHADEFGGAFQIYLVDEILNSWSYRVLFAESGTEYLISVWVTEGGDFRISGVVESGGGREQK